jgi:hypothetical protein
MSDQLEKDSKPQHDSATQNPMARTKKSGVAGIIDAIKKQIRKITREREKPKF